MEQTKSKSMAVSARHRRVFDSFLVTHGRRAFILRTQTYVDTPAYVAGAPIRMGAEKPKNADC